MMLDKLDKLDKYGCTYFYYINDIDILVKCRNTTLYLCKPYNLLDPHDTKYKMIFKKYNSVDDCLKSCESHFEIQKITNKIEGLRRIFGNVFDGEMISDGLPVSGILMEHINGIDLFTFINDEEYFYKDIIEISRQILKTLDELHRCGFMHRDIKPENIMVVHPQQRKDNRQSGFVIKIIDCEFAVKADRASTCLGTPVYASPEILKQQEYNNKCDIYSFGLLLYELVERKNLYNSIYDPSEFNNADISSKNNSKNNAIFYSRLMTGYEKFLDFFTLGQLWSSSLCELLTGCLKVNPNKRLTAADALQILEED